VSLERAGEAWKVSQVRGENLPMKKVAPDPEIVLSVAAAHAESMRSLATTAAELLAPVPAQRARSGDSALLDWIHSVQLRESGAELSVCSVLSQKPQDWKAGPLTVRQIWQLYPYENSLVTVRATGREIREALERAAGCFADPGGRLRDCDTLEGAEYVLDPSRPRGKRVASLTRRGREVLPEDVFTVALNSHRASGGGGYGMWRRAERVKEAGNIRDMLIADARAKKRLKLEPSGNWKLAATP
jgi:2',3'-cyclic-nucleotide 2'-phosphodiesterase/3'-nucleotidase